MKERVVLEGTVRAKRTERSVDTLHTKERDREGGTAYRAVPDQQRGFEKCQHFSSAGSRA